MKRPLIIILILLILLSVLASLFIFRIESSMVDFEVNYTAGKRLKWGETLYRVEDEHFMFKYPPPAAILYVPLSYLPIGIAKAIWFFLVILSSVAIVLLSRHLFPENRRPAKWTLLIPVLVLTRYFFREIELGQINALITAILLIMTIVLIRSEKKQSRILEVAGGILWGIAVVLKPYAVVFFPYFILRKKVIPAISGMLWICIALAIPIYYYGWNGNKVVLYEWITSLSQSTPRLTATQDNISIFALFAKWTDNAAWAVYPALFSIFVLGLFILLAINKRSKQNSPTALESSLILMCIPLVSPLGWDYTLLMALPGLMIIICHFFSLPELARWILAINLSVIFFSLYDIMGRELYASFMSFSVITLNFLILMAYLFYLRFKTIC